MEDPLDFETTQKPEEGDVRRRPQQMRSRQKVEAILDATAALVGERGIDSVAMRDIARAIDAPLSVIYQYFPNKSAIVAMLYGRLTEQTRRTTASAVADIRSAEEFVRMLEQLLDGYYALVRGQPLMADIVSAVLADKKLQHLDVEDSRWHAAQLSKAGAPFVPANKQDEFGRAVFLFNHLIGGLMPLLLSLSEDEARAILEDYKRLARQQLNALME